MGLGVRACKRFLQRQCRVYMRRMEKNMETTGVIEIIEGYDIGVTNYWVAVKELAKTKLL